MSNFSAEAFDSVSAPRRTAWRAFGRSLARAARAALPQCCELCVAAAGSELLCAACAAGLPRVPAACPRCALPTAEGSTCGACLAHPPPWTRTVAALVYAFPTDRLLQQLKYGGRLALADWAGEALASAVRASLAERPDADRPDRIVPLPLATARQRERGFNQAREIAVRVARAVALPLSNPLARTGSATPQATLAWKERARNVRGTFAAQREVEGARIALVDDVMTTGATLGEAARTLVRAGAAQVECWVVARTPPPGDA